MTKVANATIGNASNATFNTFSVLADFRYMLTAAKPERIVSHRNNSAACAVRSALRLSEAIERARNKKHADTRVVTLRGFVLIR